MANLTLSLNSASALALREFAEAMPMAMQNIQDDTEHLFQVYQSVSDKVGVHGDDFLNLLDSIKAVQDNAAQAINALPHMLIETAVKIEQYVGKGAVME